MVANNKTRRNNNRRNNKKSRRNNHRGGAGLYHGGAGLFRTVVAPVTGTLSLAGNVAGRGLNLAVNIPLTAVKGTKNVVSKSLRNLIAGVGSLGDNAANGLDRTVRNTFGRS